MTTESTDYHVAILMHESTAIPFEETIADLLTQFFVSARSYLHTSILVEGLHSTLDIASKKQRESVGQKRRPPEQAESLVLVDHNNYLKECVPTTAQFDHQSADVLITLCHGFGPENGIPAGLCFRCDGRGEGTFDTVVFAKPYGRRPNVVTLHSVIEPCKLAILLCCRGPDVLSDYLEHLRQLQPGREPLIFPDLLISYAQTIDVWCVEIYMVLLINILDSFIIDPESVYTDTSAAIIRILQIVKLFQDDHTGFWSFMQHVGCVTDTADEKDRQELAYPPRLGNTPTFRVYGRVCNYNLSHFPSLLLENFKAIRLVRRGNADHVDPIHTTYENVPDITLTDNHNDKIDRFLRRYQATRPPAPDPVSSPSSPASSLGTFPTPSTPSTPPTPRALTSQFYDLAHLSYALAQLKQLQ